MTPPSPEPGRVVAVDVMGADRGPADIVEGARRAAEELGVPVLLVGKPDAIGDAGDLEVLAADDVIGMEEDPAGALRRKKDASVVRAAEAVKTGRAGAMVSAGNTGAAMASALLRMGRLSGVTRPAIATPIPVHGSTPTVLLDAGANSECQPGWLVQFAQMGAVLARERFEIDHPRVGLLSIGEEASKGTALVREAHGLLAAAADGFEFIGNVEGRDLLTDQVDVVVTDGFTGNVVLKTLEGAVAFVKGAIFSTMTSTDEAKQASQVIMPLLAPLASELDPDSYGGAILLGVDGVCVISHGSSSAKAVFNAVRVAEDMIQHDLVGRLRQAVAS
ncbi:MAG TPA: phosphate acyltransferase PlsX [Acidimicrobiales bacterium]|nr:phosphate acyltransferase PlsX [Acidimicrobiales bacterium]